MTGARGWRSLLRMKHTDHTLYWYCRHAVPTKDKITGEYLTGCAWSIDRRPVEGWLCWELRSIDKLRRYNNVKIY